MKYLNAGAWIFTIVGIGLIAAHWDAVKWYWANRETIDQAVQTSDALKQMGILK